MVRACWVKPSFTRQRNEKPFGSGDWLIHVHGGLGFRQWTSKLIYFVYESISRYVVSYLLSMLSKNTIVCVILRTLTRLVLRDGDDEKQWEWSKQVIPVYWVGTWEAALLQQLRVIVSLSKGKERARSEVLQLEKTFLPLANITLVILPINIYNYKSSLRSVVGQVNIIFSFFIFIKWRMKKLLK